jgi:hypothetical protein
MNNALKLVPVWTRLELGAGLFCLLLTSIAANLGLAGRSSIPGRRALANWIPIAILAITAIFLKQPEFALTIIFSTSVASLTLVLGAILTTANDPQAAMGFRKLWPFLIPASLITLLAGFSNQISGMHAIALVMEGVILLPLWQEAEAQQPSTNPHPHLHRKWTIWLIALAIPVAVIGGMNVVKSATHLSLNLPGIGSQYLVALAATPILVAPMLVNGAFIAQRGGYAVAVNTAVGMVLLNLCLLVPICAYIWMFRSAAVGHSATDIVGMFNSLQTSQRLPFSMITWRTDNVLVLLLGFMMLPLALDRWRPGVAEGSTLICLYGLYMVMETAAVLQYWMA